MMDYSSGNKRAWEYNAYEFWLKEEGHPCKKADKIRENPAAMLKKYSAYFDTYEGRKIANICGSCGTMICSDFHPFTKIADILNLEQPSMSYFSTAVFEGEMAHARFYEDSVRRQMPRCSYRKYTVSEIINAVINNKFILKRFDEHPAWDNPDVPGEFTITADRGVR